MNTAETTRESLGSDFPGPFARFLLRLLVPSSRRDEFVGDLIEEAETIILPKHGHRAARRWFWRQAVMSASPLFARRCAKEVGMNRWRWIVVALLMLAGPLMALDPNVFQGPVAAIVLVGLAIAIPATSGLLSGNLKTHAGAAFSSAILLLAARLVSGIELRWYAMAWIFFIILAFNWIYEKKIADSQREGDSASRPASS